MGEAHPTLVLHVPAMCCRHDVRAVSACIADLPGVVAIAVDRAARTVVVEGEVAPEAVRAAVAAVGYEVS